MKLNLTEIPLKFDVEIHVPDDGEQIDPTIDTQKQFISFDLNPIEKKVLGIPIITNLILMGSKFKVPFNISNTKHINILDKSMSSIIYNNFKTNIIPKDYKQKFEIKENSIFDMFNSVLDNDKIDISSYLQEISDVLNHKISSRVLNDYKNEGFNVKNYKPLSITEQQGTFFEDSLKIDLEFVSNIDLIYEGVCLSLRPKTKIKIRKNDGATLKQNEFYNDGDETLIISYGNKGTQVLADLQINGDTSLKGTRDIFYHIETSFFTNEWSIKEKNIELYDHNNYFGTLSIPFSDFAAHDKRNKPIHIIKHNITIQQPIDKIDDLITMFNTFKEKLNADYNLSLSYRPEKDNDLEQDSPYPRGVGTPAWRPLSYKFSYLRSGKKHPPVCNRCGNCGESDTQLNDTYI